MTHIVGEEVLSSAAAKLLEEKSKLEVTVIAQPGTEINSSNLKVPLNQLFSSMIPQVDADKVIELQTLAKKSKKTENELPELRFRDFEKQKLTTGRVLRK
ncbi:hypothetical protein QL285_088826 [Trifolium repens]|nr:hypothetical protein QL285_088826 [Trifolium repens]